MISLAKRASKEEAARPPKRAAVFPAGDTPASLEVQRLRSRLAVQVLRLAGQTLLPRTLGRFSSTSSLFLSVPLLTL